jgi:hypothetical protein
VITRGICIGAIIYSEMNGLLDLLVLTSAAVIVNRPAALAAADVITSSYWLRCT